MKSPNLQMDPQQKERNWAINLIEHKEDKVAESYQTLWANKKSEQEQINFLKYTIKRLNNLFS